MFILRDKSLSYKKLKKFVLDRIKMVIFLLRRSVQLFHLSKNYSYSGKIISCED